MIFVTVGTTLPFDELVEFVDGMAARGAFDEPVVCQIGPGTYEPRHCEFFRFKPSLDFEIEQASLVIGHGGTGTVTGLLGSGKRFIIVTNPIGANDHQAEFLARISREYPILWTSKVEDLPALMRSEPPTPRNDRKPARLGDDLVNFLRARVAQVRQP